MRGAMAVKPYSGEYLNYDIADYPSVKIHFPFNETSGNILTDEVLGIIYNPVQNNGGYVDRSGPEHSVRILRGGTKPFPLQGAGYPTFPAGSYIYLVQVYHAELTGDPGISGGSSSIGRMYADDGVTRLPIIAGGTRQGAHFVINDDANNFTNTLPNAAKTTTAGNDYAVITIIRPIGQNHEILCINSDGTTAWSETVANTATGAITPAPYGGGGELIGQGALYQRICYQFDAEPSDYLTAMKWHASSAPRGQKSPYPGWKYKV